MSNSYLIVLIVFTLISINASSYIYKSSVVQDEAYPDDRESSSETDSAPSDVDQPQIVDDIPPTTTQPPPSTTTTQAIRPSDDEVNQNRIDLQGVVKAKLIGRSDNFDHKEDRNHRAYVLSNVETYQLPSNDLLIRSRIVAHVDWIIRRQPIQPRLMDHQSSEVTDQGDDDRRSTTTVAGRRKRQADMMTTTHYQPNGGMDQGLPAMKPNGDPNMRENAVMDRFRSFIGRMRDIVTKIRDTFNGDRVNTNMQGIPNSVPQ